MRSQKLGNTKIEVSEISFGCMSLEHDKKYSVSLLRKAHDHGINFFDTADLYDKGWNEEMVGKALKPVRDKVVIATKVGNEWREDGSGWDWNPRKEYILKAVEESLRRLQTDHIDLYQLHGGTIDDPTHEAIEAFELLKKQGKIRAYGISSIRPNVIRRWVNDSNLSSVMMQYSLLDRRPEEECLDLLHEHGVSVITRGTLAKGLLIHKPAKEYMNYTAEEVQQMQRSVQQTGHPVAAAIQYVLQHPAVASAVIGIRTMDQLESVLSGINSSVSQDKLLSLSDVLPVNTYQAHR